MEVGEFLINYAIKLNDKNIYFPVWGICLGFEMISLTISKNISILDNINNIDRSSHLNFY
tara:strand:+ start:255 stop:434 length:180 start_codon:yes stop_codon:yes gene_type:complete